MKMAILVVLLLLVPATVVRADSITGTYTATEVAIQFDPTNTTGQSLDWLVRGPSIGGDDEVAVLVGITSIPGFDTFGLAIQEGNGDWVISHVIFGTDFPVGYSLSATVTLGPTGVPTPEPSTFLLVGLPLLFMLGLMRKRILDVS